MHAACGASSSHITNADAIAVLELYRPHEEASKEMQEYRIADFPPENPQSDIHALESIDDSPDDPDDCNFEIDWNPPAHHYTKHKTSEELALQ